MTLLPQSLSTGTTACTSMSVRRTCIYTLYPGNEIEPLTCKIMRRMD